MLDTTMSIDNASEEMFSRCNDAAAVAVIFRLEC